MSKYVQKLVKVSTIQKLMADVVCKNPAFPLKKEFSNPNLRI
jgi:hypothetical protein